MKQILILLLLFTGIVNAQIVNIPDPAFKQYLLDHNPPVDLNGDNEIEVDEASFFGSPMLMGLSESAITDLTGIQAFTNLSYLDCAGLSLTTLDVSGMTNLNTLYCYQNNITSLNVTGCTNLQFLWAFNNQITSLDVSGMSGLRELDVQDNLLTNLNTSGATGLWELFCYNNQITSLDVTGMTSLYFLSVMGNQLTSLDVSGLTALQYFGCYDNQLTSIDVSECTALITFTFYDNPQLIEVYMKNGRTEDTGIVINCPLLQFVCADASQVDTLQNIINTEGISTTVVSSYCTFVPGGNYNSIAGTVLYDMDGNGCTAGDIIPNNVKITMSYAGGESAVFINNNSAYDLDAGTGDYLVSAALENPTYFTVSPTSATVNFAALDGSVHVENFCIAANGIHPDLEVVIAPIGTAQPGFDANYTIVYRNIGTETLSGVLSMQFQEPILDLVSSSLVPNTILPGVLEYNFANMLPFETRVIDIVFSINAPTDTPPVNLGDTLTFPATITSTAGIDDNISNNNFTLLQNIVGSHDPNSKEVLEGPIVSPQEIGKYLHYIIHFENIGNAPAQNIVVADLINETNYDMNSFQIINASHAVETKITGNKVEFIFEGINLPSRFADPIGGHGNVLFKIRSKSDLVTGDFVSNNANIYFDYNFPILTNDAITTFTALSRDIFNTDNTVSIYPNPADNLININAESNIKTIQLFDVQGRLLHTSIENKNVVTIDISNKRYGIYFVKVTTDQGAKVEKILKE